MEKLLPVLAVMIDGIVGDPRSNLHPVALIGSLIAFFERNFLKPVHSPLRKKLAGTMLVLLVLVITYSVVGLIVQLLGKFHPVVELMGGAIILSFAISPRSLAEAGQEIRKYLLEGNLNQARFKLGWIVGRDTKHLDTSEVTRATVETIAENIVDGIISPLVYFAIGGVALAFLYRAVNTMDSMIGYKNEKYRDFGMAAARVDDVFNFIPARVTAILIVVATAVLRYDTVNAVRTIWRDASKHPSPNSGYAEAGVAGALRVRLGGLNYYGGVPSVRAYMGEEHTQLAPKHIQQTINIMYFVTMLFVTLMTAVQLLT